MNACPDCPLTRAGSNRESGLLRVSLLDGERWSCIGERGIQTLGVGWPEGTLASPWHRAGTPSPGCHAVTARRHLSTKGTLSSQSPALLKENYRGLSPTPANQTQGWSLGRDPSSQSPAGTSPGPPGLRAALMEPSWGCFLCPWPGPRPRRHTVGVQGHLLAGCGVGTALSTSEAGPLGAPCCLWASLLFLDGAKCGLHL